jgi:hypothetical protein
MYIGEYTSVAGLFCSYAKFYSNVQKFNRKKINTKFNHVIALFSNYEIT